MRVIFDGPAVDHENHIYEMDAVPREGELVSLDDELCEIVSVIWDPSRDLSERTETEVVIEVE